MVGRVSACLHYLPSVSSLFSFLSHSSSLKRVSIFYTCQDVMPGPPTFTTPITSLSTSPPAPIPRYQLTKVWVCLAALSLLNRLDIIDIPTLAGWLSERQLPSGGLNGRPEKLEDVCYSWWDLASLSILGKLNWINRDKLIEFILESQVSCIC